MKFKNKIFLFLVYIIFVCNEIVYYLTGHDIYDSHTRTQILYDAGETSNVLSFLNLYPERFKSKNKNFTEGYFKSDKCVSWQESERDKFEHFIEILNIQPGDAVLDMGCGHGGLVHFLRERHIDAYGISISNIQVKSNIKKYGPYFYHGDYTVPNEELENRFDFLITLGSLEHPYGGNPRLMSTYVNKQNKLIEFFVMIKKYFKRNSSKRKMLNSTLHLNNKFMNAKELFVLERFFGGCYPLIDDYSVADCFRKSGYKVLSNNDYTWHYYFASFCNKDHFGNPFDFGKIMTLMASVFYPFSIYFYIYHTYGYWAWQFDNKHHYERKDEVCNPKNGCDLTFEKDIDKRPVTLFYTIAQI